MKLRVSFPAAFIAVVILSISAYFTIRGTNYWKLNRQVARYAGSESCLPCHEKFYQLWAPSYHGLAMQPVSADFINSNISVLNANEDVGESRFEINGNNNELIFKEISALGDTNTYKAIHVMGGKYVFYFLTEFERGRLHVLPLAYDCDKEMWYNNPESGVRHFENMEDEPLDWKNHLYTFNTSCYNCHVSQLNSNFDLETLEYTTSWREPGINCETCHGPSHEHIRTCVKAGKNKIPDDLKIIQTSKFSQQQNNSSCGSCHGKSSVIATGFNPGDRYYDYFNLITLENQDFYADGRDLGENYTMTTWEMNKCKAGGQLDCVSCHTSSGRYRFAGNNPNEACTPCHIDKVENPGVHTFHKEDGEGSICISCHMPKTTFAKMDRSDHSFRPPMPEASIEFGSPNACNICHSNKSVVWANKDVKSKHRSNYQETTIYAGKLIADARAANWDRLDEIINGLNNGSFDDVFTTSFIRLLENCDNDLKWDAIFKKTTHVSPLVRSSAAHALFNNYGQESFDLLTQMTEDDYRLVRLNAAFALSNNPYAMSLLNENKPMNEALTEYKNSLISKNDDWTAYYNLGNFYSNMGDNSKALEAYLNSVKVYPKALMPMINAGYLYSLSGDIISAEKMFELALSYSPDNEAALLNLALLYGESGREDRAIACFRSLLIVSEDNATAAFNLGVLLAEEDELESLQLIEKARMLNTNNPRYSYTYAFYLVKYDDFDKARIVLKELINMHPLYPDAYLLLSDLEIKSGNNARAQRILEDAISSELFGEDQLQRFNNMLSAVRAQTK